MSALDIAIMMLPAFAMCLVLVGIHSYLGLHVIKRKVIFIDLALAQIAALGTLLAYLFGIMPQTAAAYWFSLGLTALAAGIFAVTRLKESRIPQEAIIGLVYAIAAAMAILLIDKAPHGAEHLKDIMTGHILLIKWDAVLTAAIVYAIVGLLHYLFRHRFIMISENPEEAWEKGIHVRLWEFLFYLSFGAVITLSVSSAGVLIVFVFLVAPAILSIMITDSWRAQIIVGWIVGTLVSIVGLSLSYVLDLPTGPAVIGSYGAVMLVVAAARYINRHSQRVVAMRNVALTVLVFLASFAFIVLSGHWLKPAPEEHVESEREAASLPGEREDALSGLDTDAFETKIVAVDDFAEIEELFARVVDPDCVAPLVLRALEVDRRQGARLAMEYLRQEPPAFFCQNVIERLDELMGTASSYDPDKAFLDPGNQRASERIVTFFGLPGETLLKCPDGTLLQSAAEGQSRRAWCETPGTREGPMLEWYENGQMSVRSEYRNGELHGPHRRWHRSGEKEEDGEYRGGEREGQWSWWDRGGEKSRGCRYHAGQELECHEP